MWTSRSTASARPAPTADRRRRDAGTAVVGTLVGFAIFLTLLLFAAQVLVRLYATSTLTSAATRAAETVAQASVPAEQEAAAEAAARSQLGGFGADHTSFDWKEADGTQVVLQVTASSPGFLPLPASWRAITRTVVVRTERFR